METQHYKITVGDKSEIALGSTKAWERAADMVKANGGGVPDIKPCDAAGNITDPANNNVRTAVTVPAIPRPQLPEATATAPVAPQKEYSDWGNTKLDEQAKTRIEGLHAAIEKAGGPKIDTSEQFFKTGTRMAKEGYSTQQKREQEHFRKPKLTEAIEQLEKRVSSEIRRDFKMTSREIAKGIEVDDGEVYLRDHTLSEQAIRGLILRLESPAISYLLAIRNRSETEAKLSGADQTRVHNDKTMLAEILRHECMRNPDVEFKMRMREDPRDIYAVLSPSYPVADAPHVMEQILEQMPQDARGSWEYNPQTTAWELKASIWTPVPTDEQAVGEPFEGYVSLSSRDNGTGSFNGGGGINLLRCLNASTYSAGDAELRRIHRGDGMLFDVKDMIAKSLRAISALCKAWGKAREDEIDVPSGLTLEQAMPGFWRSLLKEGELVSVLPGRKEVHAKALTRTYFEERRDPNRLVRADLAQSWTRYIQDQPSEVRRDAEMAIGKWVVQPPKHIRCDMKE